MSSNAKLISLNGNQIKFHVPTVLYENRYCNQDDFSILICGGQNGNREPLNDVYELKWPKLKLIKFPSMLEPRKECKTAVIGSDIFVVGGYKTNSYNYLSSVEMYSKENNAWCYKTQLPDKRINFCICSFKQYLYIIGGWGFGCNKILSTCLVYNIKHDKWSQIADMNDKRELAACTVFEGKIVVSGGLKSKSVEAYDFYEDKWTYLPYMILKRYDHASVSISNKMFMIGGWNTSTCEVFNSFSRKFTSIKSLVKLKWTYFQAVSIGSDIVVFSIPIVYNKNSIVKMYVYDKEIDDYSAVASKICENAVGVSCVKYYSL